MKAPSSKLVVKAPLNPSCNRSESAINIDLKYSDTGCHEQYIYWQVHAAPIISA
jgi:hypothetical protein